MFSLVNLKLSDTQKSAMGLLVLVVSVASSILLFGSKGTVDARNWEVIFQDILVRGPAFIPDCLNYLCPSNLILTKFPLGHALIFYIFSLVFPVKVLGTLISMKMLIMLFYVATLGSVLWFSRSVGSEKLSVFYRIVLYLSMFSLILNTQGLAYTDVLAFPFLVISIMFILQKRFFWGGCLFGISCLVKWQPVILLPIIFTYGVTTPKGKERTRMLMQFVGGLFGSVLVFLPFTSDVVAGILLSLRNVLLHTTTYALNLQWVLQNLPIASLAVPLYESPSPAWAWVQLGVFAVGYALVCWNVYEHRHSKGREANLLHSFLLAALVYYLFSFGVHENHFILGSIVALLLYMYHPTLRNYIIFRVVDIINILNLFVFYGFTGVSMLGQHQSGIDGSVLLAFAITVVSVAYLWIVLLPKRVAA